MTPRIALDVEAARLSLTEAYASWSDVHEHLRRAITEIARLREQVAGLTRELAASDTARHTADATQKLAAFGAVCLRKYRDEFGGYDLEAGWLHDVATTTGVLETHPVTTSCGNGCVCAEYGFPSECSVIPDDVFTSASRLLDSAMQAGEKP